MADYASKLVIDSEVGSGDDHLCKDVRYAIANI